MTFCSASGVAVFRLLALMILFEISQYNWAALLLNVIVLKSVLEILVRSRELLENALGDATFQNNSLQNSQQFF